MVSSEAAQPGFVTYILYGFYLTLTRGMAMPTHQHHTLQLTLSADVPFIAHVGEGELVGRGLLIGSGQPHATPATPGTLVNFLIEPESEAGRQMNHVLLNHRASVPLSDDLVESFAPLLRTLDSVEQLPKEQIITVYQQVVAALIGATASLPTRDARIEEALQRLITLPEKRMSARALSSSVALSESRLLHLFKAETGTTLRAYLLWLRLGQALKLIWTGVPLTEAAHTAGFADAAHLSRTARQTFGTALSSLAKGAWNFQVYVYEEPFPHTAD